MLPVTLGRQRLLAIGTLLSLCLLWRLVRYELLAIRLVKLPHDNLLTVDSVHAEYGVSNHVNLPR